jgi:sugar phosphate isomerase/epimerase
MLDPFAYILHLDKPDEPLPSYAALREWRARTAESVQRLLPPGLSPTRICIENLDYPFEWVFPLVEELGLSICLDVGHLLLLGGSPPSAFDTYGSKIRVVHLHGVHEKTDHLPLAHLDPTLLKRLYTQLSCDPSTERVVTLEVFDAEQLRESLITMEKLIR